METDHLALDRVGGQTKPTRRDVTTRPTPAVGKTRACAERKHHSNQSLFVGFVKRPMRVS